MMAAAEPKIELPDVGVVPGATRIVDDVYSYDEKKDQIGEGTYGKVYKGTDKKGSQVALKMIRMDNEKEGFPITAIREIKLLSTLKHENIVNLREIVRSRVSKEDKYKGNIFMVFDYAAHDLTGMQEAVKPKGLSLPQVKCIMLQLLRGLAYCHKNGILHRDLKASNLLITQGGVLKIADFGLARNYNDEQGRLTNRVITLWYRPPELLLGAERYGPEVDVWSCGCIFAELLAKKPLFPGKNETEQLDWIFKLMGAPSEEAWKGVSDLEFFKNVKVQNYKKGPENFDAWCNQHGVKGDCAELLKSMLALDPAKRITATDAALHPYFYDRKEPACEPEGLPKLKDCHEWTTKNAKRKQQEQHQQQRHPQHHHQQQQHQYGHHAGHHAGYAQQQQQQHGGPPHGGQHYVSGPPVSAAAGGQQAYPRNVRPRTGGPGVGQHGVPPPAAAVRGGYAGGPPRPGGGYAPQGPAYGGYGGSGGGGYTGGGGYPGHHQQMPPGAGPQYRGAPPPQQQQQRGGYSHSGPHRR